MSKKLLFGLAPLLAVAAFALSPSAAMAGTEPCRVLTWGTASQGVGTSTCNNPPGVTAPQNLREEEDGAGTTPISTNFPTSGLLVNTKGILRFKSKIAGVGVKNENPLGYAFFGVKLESDPVSSSTVCRAATGSVPWADIQDATPSGVFDDTSSWPFTLVSNSTACPTESRGKVTIREVSLLFETLGAGKTPVVATGTFVGTYEKPGANCPAGGIKLNTVQTGVTTEPESKEIEVDNGTTGENAYLCFVSAENYVFPEEAPKWKLKEGTGIWKD